MKQKRMLSWVLALGTALLLLAGCGASGSSSAPAADQVMGNGDMGFVETGESMSDSKAEMQENASDAPMEAPADQEETPARQEAKLIYRGTLSLETTEYDTVVQELASLVTEYGGYIENSRHNNNGYRSADYTVRVPKENYRPFFTKVGGLCHVNWQDEEVENVTRYYYDVAGRLKTQETKLQRLQELLQQAEDMEDIITLESAISDTEYQIETMTGELRYYDDLVDYATVTIYVNEVYKVSGQREAPIGFGAKLVNSLQNGWRSFERGIEDLLIFLSFNLMWILMWALILIAAVVLIRRYRRKHPRLARQRKQKAEAEAASEKSKDNP